MKDISELVAQVLELKEASEVNLLDVDPTVLPGRTALRNSAFQQYLEHFAVLKTVLGEHAGAIFVLGPGADTFAKLAEAQGPALVLDAAEMYRKVAEHWYPTVRVDKVFAIDCVMSMLGGMTQLLAPLGIREIARPDFGKHFGRQVLDLDDATAVTRDILRETVGDDLNGLYLNNRLVEEAVKAEWDLKVVPVVIVNATKTELEAKDGLAIGLFYGRNIVTHAGEPVGKSEVLQACKQLHARMKKHEAHATVALEAFKVPDSPQVEGFDEPKHEPNETPEPNHG